MQELFIEIFSEEIPAQFQHDAAKQFANLLEGEFSAFNIGEFNIKAECSMHRLSACITEFPKTIPSQTEEIRGPRISAPDLALEGFMRKYQITKGDLKQRDDFYYYYLTTPELKMRDIAADLVKIVLTKFTWPKSMHWAQSLESTWVRPLRSIVCLLNGEVLDMTHCNIKSGDVTFGHRVHTDSKKITVKNYQDYCTKLLANSVVFEYQKRKQMILDHAQEIASKKNLFLREDENLVSEICGLVEQPQVLLGHIADHFMQLPDEVLISSIRTNQKYLLLCDAKQKLAPYFIIVADGAYDDTAKIIKGNQKVLSARLSDAEFFFQNDLKTPFAERLEALKGQVYHSKIGSLYDKVMRMEELGKQLATHFGVSTEAVTKAIRLCKCDLITQMVFEFPELQGIMGYYYAESQGVSKDIAISIRDHYKPQGPNDTVPHNKIGAVVALSDKLDSLIELFNIGIKPTGNKDPFAQRRAAIGILRILEEFEVSLDLTKFIEDKELIQFIESRKKN